MRIAGAAPAACRSARHCARDHHVRARISSKAASDVNAAAFTIAVVSQGCKPSNCAQTTATWQSIGCCPPKPSQRSKMYMPVLVITGSSLSADAAALAGRAGSSSPRSANGSFSVMCGAQRVIRGRSQRGWRYGVLCAWGRLVICADQEQGIGCKVDRYYCESGAAVQPVSARGVAGAQAAR